MTSNSWEDYCDALEVTVAIVAHGFGVFIQVRLTG